MEGRWFLSTVSFEYAHYKNEGFRTRIPQWVSHWVQSSGNTTWDHILLPKSHLISFPYTIFFLQVKEKMSSGHSSNFLQTAKKVQQ